MIDFSTACETAISKLKEEKCKKGLFEAYDLEDKWLFFGRTLPLGETEYGFNTVAIDKNTGEIVPFCATAFEGLLEWEKAPRIYIPTRYLIHELRKKIRKDKEGMLE